MALYGAEIWGWKNETRLDRIKRKYVKWILGLDRKTELYTNRRNKNDRNKNRSN